MVHGAKFSKMMMPLRPRMPSREMRRQPWRIVAILFAVAAITHLRSSRPHDPPYMRANQDAKQSESDPQGISMTAAITDDLREFALLKAKQTPGWGNRNENEMYMYAPQEEYERLRFLYDINPPKMPLPFQSILSPTTISRLNLNAVDRSSSHTQPYTDDDVIQTLSRFEHVGFILRYSGKTDEFRLYAPTTHNWSRYDQIEAYTAFIRILRKEYWFRFTKGNSDFSVLFSTGDSLKMDCGCLSTPMDRESAPSSDVNDNPINFQQQFNSVGKMTTCDRYHLAPILQFGSGFAHPDVMPTMVTMPLWPHLKCFETFRYDGKVCNKFSPVSAKNRFGIYFAEEEKRIYDNMIPQIIWRGSDYPFLNCRQGGGSKWNIKAMDVPGGPKNQVGFVKGLVHLWGQLNPRWKAVTLSLQAELDAKNLNQNEVKPWVDFKFTSRPGESQRWEGFVKNGANIVANGYIDAKELSSFKYHADFGGGGGTTWKGSLVKLALPGVLFHHETPSYDYFHEELIPFVHYIPVSTELEDLREKYEWAEKHPDEARAISEAGTAFIKYMTSAEYWTRSFDRFFVKRLNSVIVAYSPIKAFKDEDEFMTYAESQLGHPVELIGRCDVEQRCKWKDK
ncbi:hypothetical protein ACHAXM_001540 [Skeletonema potamos]